MRPNGLVEGGIRSKMGGNSQKGVMSFEDKAIVAVCEGKTPDSVTGIVFAAFLIRIIKSLLSVSA
jgi:hypothetical protein